MILFPIQGENSFKKDKKYSIQDGNLKASGRVWYCLVQSSSQQVKLGR